MLSFSVWNRSALAAASFTALASVAHAQGSSPQTQTSIGSYCSTGVASVIRQIEQQARPTSGDRRPMPSITTLFERCQPGDTIAISSTEVAGIGSMCDFPKAIVTSADTVLCVFNGIRGGR
jgi:hypothetical protein